MIVEARAGGATQEGGRPLIVSDVDEVAVHFIRPLELYLQRVGYRLDATSYGLSGNIRRAGTSLNVTKEEVRQLLVDFFDAEIHRQELVDDVAAVLGRLASVAEIVLLTNAPHVHGETRRRSLAAQGLPFPLLTNDGPKGPAMRRLAEGVGGPVFFIDDSPTNLSSVLDALPEAHVIQFVADARFFAMARDVAGVALRTNSWLEVEAYVTAVIGGS